MNSLIAFITGCFFGVIITTGIVMILKSKKAKKKELVTSGGANKPSATEGKPPMANQT